MLLLAACDGDHARLLAARERCAARERESGIADEPHRVWSRAVDLCDQALRVIEGAGAVNDERTRRILVAVCHYETSKSSLGFIPGVIETSVRALTEELREIGATMADVPSAEQLVTWAFPWL
jgi:hypothetical protein